MNQSTFTELGILARVEKALELLEKIDQLKNEQARELLTQAVLVQFQSILPIPVPETKLDVSQFPGVDKGRAKQAFPIVSNSHVIRAQSSKERKRRDGFKSKADRVLEYVNQLGESGFTAADLEDLVDPDLKVEIANHLSYLKRSGRIRAVMSQGFRDRAGVVREMFVYYPLSGPIKPHVEDSISSDHTG